MRKAKIKKIKVALGNKSEEIATMFNQMLGTGTANIPIAYPRYKRLKIICEQLVKLFGLLRDSPFMSNYKEFQPQLEQLQVFCELAHKRITDTFSVDLDDAESDYSRLTKDQEEAFSVAYEKVKKSDLVRTFIVMCDRLAPYKKNFIDLDSLNPKFITTMAGTEWIPFPFTSLNIKYIFTLPRVGENTISFFMAILNKSYVLSKQLYDELRTPDIDIDKISEIIMTNIDKIQRQPELSRCGEAFRKIRESVGLLKTNLTEYYHDFLATNDSTIIMQHFIIDVQKETNASPVVVRQFVTIAEYYRKIARSSVKDPQITALLDKIEDSFRDLARGTNNMVDIDKEETEDNNSDSDSDSGADRIVSPAAIGIGQLTLDDEPKKDTQ